MNCSVSRRRKKLLETGFLTMKNVPRSVSWRLIFRSLRNFGGDEIMVRSNHEINTALQCCSSPFPGATAAVRAVKRNALDDGIPGACPSSQAPDSYHLVRKVAGPLSGNLPLP